MRNPSYCVYEGREEKRCCKNEPDGRESQMETSGFVATETLRGSHADRRRERPRVERRALEEEKKSERPKRKLQADRRIENKTWFFELISRCTQGGRVSIHVQVFGYY